MHDDDDEYQVPPWLGTVSGPPYVIYHDDRPDE